MFNVRRKTFNLGFTSAEIQLKLYDSQIMPILLYGSELWGYNNMNSIENIHMKHCKFVLNVHQSCPNEGVRNELGRFPIKDYHLIRMFNYWIKINNMEDTRLPKICYQNQKSWAEKGIDCWALGMKTVLEQLGFRVYVEHSC